MGDKNLKKLKRLVKLDSKENLKKTRKTNVLEFFFEESRIMPFSFALGVFFIIILFSFVVKDSFLYFMYSNIRYVFYTYFLMNLCFLIVNIFVLFLSNSGKKIIEIHSIKNIIKIINPFDFTMLYKHESRSLIEKEIDIFIESLTNEDIFNMLNEIDLNNPVDFMYYELYLKEKIKNILEIDISKKPMEDFYLKNIKKEDLMETL